MATKLKKIKNKNAEGSIQNEILNYLADQKGIYFFRMNNIPAFTKLPSGKIQMRKLPKYTPKGLPDIIVIKKGIFYGLEVKKSEPKTYQSKDQKIFEANVKAHGGQYYVVRSVQDVKMIPL